MVLWLKETLNYLKFQIDWLKATWPNPHFLTVSGDKKKRNYLEMIGICK